uniref:Uncharacterized protein n=1 Tax=Heliothis virescens TaxID=7102 RepID=A0A2A4JZM4_HELVI
MAVHRSEEKKVQRHSTLCAAVVHSGVLLLSQHDAADGAAVGVGVVYAFYGLRKDSRHFIRLDPLAKGLLLNRQWGVTGAPVTWRVDRFHDTDPWAVPDIKAARGWAAGAVLLALLVLIVRAAENCLHKKLFKAIYMHTNVGAGEMQQDVLQGHYRLQGVRRQESDEWSTPNVMATSLQQHPYESRVSGGAGEAARDLPPPYSQCAAKRDDPPPPYSACYVTYSARPHQPPAVHLHPRGHSARDARDNEHNDLIEHALRADAAPDAGAPHCAADDAGLRTELVFDNGRIVERRSTDLSSNNDSAASSAGVEHTGQAEFKDRVVYVDETAPPSATAERALLV